MFYHDSSNVLIFGMLAACVLLVFLKRYFQKRARLFKESREALEKHLVVLNRIVNTEHIQESEKKKFINLTLFISSRKGSKRFLDLLERGLLGMKTNEDQRDQKEKNEFSSIPAREILAFFVTAIFVAGYETGNISLALGLAQLFVSDEDKEMQLIYKLNWQECGAEHQEQYV